MIYRVVQTRDYVLRCHDIGFFFNQNFHRVMLRYHDGGRKTVIV